MILTMGAGACERRYIHLECPPDALCKPDDRGTGGSSGAPILASALVAGTAFSCANVANALYCWGVAPAALLGPIANDPGAPARATPVESLSTTVAAGAGDTLCAIEGGHVSCWGSNETGQLGAAPTPGCSVGNCLGPRSIVPGTDGAWMLAVSGSHGCVVTTAEDVLCWGANDNGQLGHAPGTGDQACASTDVVNCNPAATPTGVVGATTVAVGADADGAHGFGCAILDGGSVVCWGDNSKGQVSGAGYVVGATTDNAPHPVPAAITGLRASALSAGGLSICAVEASTGTVVCWGDGAAGQGATPAGVEILDGGNAGSAVHLTQATSLAHGTMHTCAVSRGTVYCWGNNRSKQLGRDAEIAFDSPCVVDGQGDYCPVMASPVAGLAGMVMVGAAGNHTCALRNDGAIFCWGSNTFQESGHPLAAFGDLDPQRTPVRVQGLPGQ
jgi:alpha-tubulin suppressor-like RCC1 family protein